MPSSLRPAVVLALGLLAVSAVLEGAASTGTAKVVREKDLTSSLAFKSLVTSNKQIKSMHLSLQQRGLSPSAQTGSFAAREMLLRDRSGKKRDVRIVAQTYANANGDVNVLLVRFVVWTG